MATKLLTMLTTALGCVATTQLASLTDADVAALNQAIVPDIKIYPVNPNTGASTVQVGTIVTATVTTTLTTMTSVALGSGPALTSNLVGSFINGQGIAGGTTVRSISGSGTNFTITMSQAPTSGVVGGSYLITQKDMNGYYQKNGWLTIPGRGQLKVMPGDVVFIDPSGWPILLSYSAMTWAGTIWKLV